MACPDMESLQGEQLLLALLLCHSPEGFNLGLPFLDQSAAGPLTAQAVDRRLQSFAAWL